MAAALERLRSLELQLQKPAMQKTNWSSLAEPAHLQWGAVLAHQMHEIGGLADWERLREVTDCPPSECSAPRTLTRSLTGAGLHRSGHA